MPILDIDIIDMLILTVVLGTTKSDFELIHKVGEVCFGYSSVMPDCLVKLECVLQSWDNIFYHQFISQGTWLFSWINNILVVNRIYIQFTSMKTHFNELFVQVVDKGVYSNK